MAAPRDRKHIIVTTAPSTVPYRPHGKAIPKRPIPTPNRQTHGAALKAALGQAQQFALGRRAAAVADGLPGRAEAANLAVVGVERQAAGLIGSEHVVALLRRLDQACERSPERGEAACVVVVVGTDGRVSGASVGDCEEWLISGGVVARLTQGSIARSDWVLAPRSR